MAAGLRGGDIGWVSTYAERYELAAAASRACRAAGARRTGHPAVRHGHDGVGRRRRATQPKRAADAARAGPSETTRRHGQTQQPRQRRPHPTLSSAGPFKRSHSTAASRCGVSRDTWAQKRGEWFNSRRCATSCATT